ncbi:MAG TPA: hypothetical protein ENN76_02385 [Euryarchaeota archaeon]|nr:hypothetical protein [Euryarchaeota archaeon]
MAESSGSSGNKSKGIRYLVIGGVCILVSFTLPVLYSFVVAFSLGLISLLCLGMDWVCCDSVNLILFVSGVVFVVMGIITMTKSDDDKTPTKRDVTVSPKPPTTESRVEKEEVVGKQVEPEQKSDN